MNATAAPKISGFLNCIASACVTPSAAAVLLQSLLSAPGSAFRRGLLRKPFSTAFLPPPAGLAPPPPLLRRASLPPPVAAGPRLRASRSFFSRASILMRSMVASSNRSVRSCASCLSSAASPSGSGRTCASKQTPASSLSPAYAHCATPPPSVAADDLLCVDLGGCPTITTKTSAAGASTAASGSAAAAAAASAGSSLAAGASAAAPADPASEEGEGAAAEAPAASEEPAEAAAAAAAEPEAAVEAPAAEVFVVMVGQPPRSTQSRSSAATEGGGVAQWAYAGDSEDAGVCFEAHVLPLPEGEAAELKQLAQDLTLRFDEATMDRIRMEARLKKLREARKRGPAATGGGKLARRSSGGGGAKPAGGGKKAVEKGFLNKPRRKAEPGALSKLWSRTAAALGVTQALAMQFKNPLIFGAAVAFMAFKGDTLAV
eukprot:TRINITY_DN16402_c0_g2_i3.p2 TRINITY_DN16402_c0_g2~~TRINITY_DN16402_c0_g2_i3.p2  ORF type:complete len:431 (-),score=138.35 TRINITY_DN16402_c0_g2_i3:335-1627(-)